MTLFQSSPHGATVSPQASPRPTGPLDALAGLRLACAYYDRDLRNRMASEGFADYFGFTPDQARGKHLRELLGEEGFVRNVPVIEQVLAGRELAFVAALDTPIGARSVLTGCVPQFDDDGTVAGFFVMLTDVTDRDRVERDLVAAQGRFRTLFEAAPVATVLVDRTGRIADANSAAANLFGRPVFELIGCLDRDLTHPDDRDKATERLAQLWRGEREQYAVEKRYVHLDGHVIHARADGRLIRDLGDGLYVLKQIQDISEQYRHAQEIAARQAYTDALLETIDVGIVSSGTDPDHVRLNRAMRDLLGLSHDEAEVFPADIIATGRVDILDPDGVPLPTSRNPLDRLLAGEEVEITELRVGPAGGPVRDVVVRGSRITAPDGALLGGVVALTDVTDLRQLSRQLDAERARLAEAQKLGQLGSFELDPSTGTFTFSDEMYRIWGLDTGADLAALREQMIHPDDLESVRTQWQELIRHGGHAQAEFRITRPDGALRHLRSTLHATLDATGRPTMLRGTHLDITDLVEAEQRAIAARHFYEAMLAATPDFTFVTDIETNALIYSGQGQTVLGRTPDQLPSGDARVSLLVHPDDRHLLIEARRAAVELADGAVLETRLRSRHLDGSWHWLSRRVTPFRRDLDTGAVREVLGVIRDITDVVTVEERLAHAALHDPLTGLPNRSLFLEQARAGLALVQQTRVPMAVLYLDLDGFKPINDTYGHAVGDDVLIETAKRIQGTLRGGDTVARLGGDEFAVLIRPWHRETSEGLRGSDPSAAAWDLARRIGRAIAEPLMFDGAEYRITASVGIALTPIDRDCTAEELLVSADQAMYEAKRSGKNRIHLRP